MRELPSDLVEQLRTARRFERMAEGLHNERAAIHATAGLMLAAIGARWKRTEIAPELGVHHQTVATPQFAGGSATPGPARSSNATCTAAAAAGRAAQGLSEREWLKRAEATAEFAGHIAGTLSNSGAVVGYCRIRNNRRLG